MLPSAGPVSIERVSGGDSHQSFRVEDSHGGQFFLKANTREFAACLQSEYQSLQEFARLGQKNYPAALGFSEHQDVALLLMTFQHYTGLTDHTASELGQALALQHRIKSDRFGWNSDNHIGLTWQQNSWSASWVEFYRERRLQPQLQSAVNNGLNSTLINQVVRLLQNLESYVDDAEVTPSLLHGDLWGGNVAYNLGEEEAAFFDPAPYYGDREADIAMTHLFGGFPTSFYESYNNAYPLKKGHQKRRPIYNLYHALNHYNLFGSAYEALVERCLVA